MTFISNLSQHYGLDERAIRFLLGQVLGYPFFLLYIMYIRKFPLNVHYIYIFTTGVSVAYFSFGLDCVYHGIVCITVNYLVLKFGPNGDKAGYYTAATLVLFQFGYLLVGYWNRQEWSEYGASIDWTQPHCILCLRLMAITIDFYDGNLRYTLI